MTAALLLQAGGITARAWEETAIPVETETVSEAETDTVKAENITSAVLYVNRVAEDSFNAVYELPEDMLSDLCKLLEQGIEVEKAETIPYPEDVDNTALACYDSDGFIYATFLSSDDSDRMYISRDDGVGIVSEEAAEKILKITDAFVNPEAVTSAETEEETEKETETGEPVLEYTTDLAWRTTDLTAKLIDDLHDHEEKNAVLSGPSIRFILGTLYHGAAGTTKQVVEGLFSTGIDQFTLQEKSTLDSWEDLKKDGMSFTNLIIKNGDVTVKKDFLKTVKELYKTEVLDMKDASDETETDTESAIDGNILNALRNTDRHASFLDFAGVSAFSGEWAEPFNTGVTEKSVFTDTDGRTYDAEMMTGTESVYLENTEAVGFMKPYSYTGEDGNPRLWFVGILPDRKTFSMEDLDLKDLVLSADNSAKVQVTIPKFDITSDLSITRALSRNGLGALFTNDADLSGMTKSVIRLSDVFAKTGITFDEGNSGSAEKAEESVPEEETETEKTATDKTETETEAEKTLVFDRPFAFGVYDSQTQEFLLLGRIDCLPES